MTIDHARVIAVQGVCGYDDADRQPGRLGFGVGTKGYSPMVQSCLVPLVTQTACRRMLGHKLWPDAGEARIPFDGPSRLESTLPQIYGTYLPALRSLHGAVPEPIEFIEYHGSVLELGAPLSESDVTRLLERLRSTLRFALELGHSVAFDEASAVKSTHPMALLLPVMAMLSGPRRRFYMEQRRGVEQTFMAGLPTVTMYSEYLKQQARGGEPFLAPFDPRVENIMVIDREPPDRDRTEGWDVWIVDAVEMLQADGFTPGVPTHSMVRRKRWDLLTEIFGRSGPVGTGELHGTC